MPISFNKVTNLNGNTELHSMPNLNLKSRVGLLTHHQKADATRYNKINSSQHKPNMSFCARSEYDYLDKNFDIRASSYFRRGQVFGSQNEKFKDVVDAIKLVLSNNQKPKILIVGVGEAQEPFSFLTVIKALSKDKPLEQIVDLNCVDLQPKISDEKLKDYSYLNTSGNEPIFAKSSFEYIENPTYNKYLHYKVKPDIFEYLKNVFNDESKTKWNTKIEEFSTIIPSESYHMASINNTIGYIKEDNAQKMVMENISKMLKTGGVLITDVYDDWYKKIYPSLNKFKNLNPGIWQKLR